MNTEIYFTIVLIAAPCAGLYFVLRRFNMQEGGREILKKYEELYKLLTQKGKIEVMRIRRNFIKVKMKVDNEVHQLTLSEMDERLVISWKLKNQGFGRVSKEWSFNPAFPQHRMYEEIRNNIRDFQLKKMRDRKINAGRFSIN